MKLSYSWPAFWRKPRGRAQYCGQLRSAIPFDLRQIDSHEAPVVLPGTDLPFEPWYRIHDGDYWHPLTDGTDLMSREAFGDFLHHGSRNSQLLARHPASILSHSIDLVSSPPKTRSGIIEDPRGVTTPFGPKVIDAASVVEVESDRAVIEELMRQAGENFLEIDGIVHRRCQGPALELSNGRWRLIDTLAQRDSVVLMGATGATLPYSVPKSLRLPASLAVTMREEYDSLPGVPQKWADLPEHPYLAGQALGSLIAGGLMWGHLAPRDGGFVKRDWDWDALPAFYFLSRDVSEGIMTPHDYVDAVANFGLGESNDPSSWRYTTGPIHHNQSVAVSLATTLCNRLEGMSLEDILPRKAAGIRGDGTTLIGDIDFPLFRVGLRSGMGRIDGNPQIDNVPEVTGPSQGPTR